MADRFAQILNDEHIVAPEILEEAQRRQVVYEGSLDTNLLELGGVSETELLRALGEAYRLPIGEKSDIDAVEAHIPRIFPLQFAEAYRMVPFRLTGPNLSVLVNSEPDPQLFARIRQRLRLHINATVTTEARLHYAMHRLYATRLLPRFYTLLTQLDGAPPKALYEPPPGEHFLSWGLPSGRLDGARRRGAGRSGTDIAALLARLDTAPNRDAVIEILMEIAYGVFDFVCMFVVQGESINGWRGIDPRETERVARISIPVSHPSVFQTIYATQSHYLGRIPENSFNQSLLEQLGRESPRTALLAPILVRGKLVAVVYADNAAKPVPSKRVSGLLLLAHRVGMCLEKLIRQRKRQQAEPASPAVHPPSATVAPPIGAVQAPTATVPPPLEDTTAPPPAFDEPEMLGDNEFEVVDDTPAEEPVTWEEPYVAFSDVGDSPEESLADWEDVLVDAAEAAMDAAQTRNSSAAPPVVGWDDVVDEALAAPSLSGDREEQHIEVAGTPVDPTDLLFDGLSARDQATRSGAVEKLLALGSAIDNQIQERFPGTLEIDLFDDSTALPSFESCSGLCALLSRRGQSVAALVFQFLESRHREQRFIATYFFLNVHYPPSIEAISGRLYDVEPKIRYLAADALRGYSNDPTYARILHGLREQLKVPVLETQVTTVQVLGQLRDPRAVPSLIPLVVSPQAPLRTAATAALAVICAQSFDQDVTQWAEWWRLHYMRPRETWLVESLRHHNLELQRIAFDELRLMTGYTGTFDAYGTAEEKEPVVQVWEAWLEELEGRRSSQLTASSAQDSL